MSASAEEKIKMTLNVTLTPEAARKIDQTDVASGLDELIYVKEISFRRLLVYYITKEMKDKNVTGMKVSRYVNEQLQKDYNYLLKMYMKFLEYDGAREEELLKKVYDDLGLDIGIFDITLPEGTNITRELFSEYNGCFNFQDLVRDGRYILEEPGDQETLEQLGAEIEYLYHPFMKRPNKNSLSFYIGVNDVERSLRSRNLETGLIEFVEEAYEGDDDRDYYYLYGYYWYNQVLKSIPAGGPVSDFEEIYSLIPYILMNPVDANVFLRYIGAIPGEVYGGLIYEDARVVFSLPDRKKTLRLIVSTLKRRSAGLDVGENYKKSCKRAGMVPVMKDTFDYYLSKGIVAIALLRKFGYPGLPMRNKEGKVEAPKEPHKIYFILYPGAIPDKVKKGYTGNKSLDNRTMYGNRTVYYGNINGWEESPSSEEIKIPQFFPRV